MKMKKEYGYPVLRGFTQNSRRYYKGELYKPDNRYRREWLSTLIRNGFVSATPECRETEEAAEAMEE